MMAGKFIFVSIKNSKSRFEPVIFDYINRRYLLVLIRENLSSLTIMMSYKT